MSYKRMVWYVGEKERLGARGAVEKKPKRGRRGFRAALGNERRDCRSLAELSSSMIRVHLIDVIRVGTGQAGGWVWVSRRSALLTEAVHYAKTQLILTAWNVLAAGVGISGGGRQGSTGWLGWIARTADRKTLIAVVAGGRPAEPASLSA